MGKTQGNPFFIVMMLNSLSKAHLIKWDSQSGSWAFDISKILSTDLTDDVHTLPRLRLIYLQVVQLMLARMTALSDESKKAISYASCIGSSFNIETLSSICETDARTLATNLWPVVKDQLLIVRGDEAGLAFDNSQLSERVRLNVAWEADEACIDRECRHVVSARQSAAGFVRDAGEEEATFHPSTHW